ncbi:MAG: hypothetical protein KC713_08375, partial [Candidatus Omnitrophica bacterium]|nr:hypothetical protein [Candidatus Omnitrophota bacterium]
KNTIKDTDEESSGGQSSGAPSIDLKPFTINFDILKAVNVLLLGCVVMAGGAALMEVLSVKKDINPVTSQGEPVTIQQSSQDQMLQIQPFDFYRERLENTEVFIAPWQRESAEEQEQQEAVSPLSVRLKLVGIVMDENPQAIIEDNQAQQTYFVSVGETIAGAVVELITPDKVKLNEGQNILELMP